MFVQDYIYTLFCKDEDADVVREFVERLVGLPVFFRHIVLLWQEFGWVVYLTAHQLKYTNHFMLKCLVRRK